MNSYCWKPTPMLIMEDLSLIVAPLSGYCIFLGGKLVTGKSKKQKEVSLSSGESES